MQENPAAAPRAVIVVSSHVVRGSVGNRAKVFTLETLGFPVWAVPTVILPWRPDLAPGEKIVPDMEQFSRLLADMGSAEWLGEVTAVLTGYFGDARQVEAVEKLVRAVKTANPNALYLCDPVIGDEGGLYVPVETATGIRDKLLPIADIATPSRHELEWLAGKPLPSMPDILAAARDLSPPTMLVTSAPSMMAKSMGNLLVTGKGAWLAEHRVIEGEPKGTGDLTSALFLAHLLNGEDGAKALEMTTASVLEIVVRAAKRGANELMLQTDTASLSHPAAAVAVRQLLQPRRRKDG
jgi:pyridoxine kinase